MDCLDVERAIAANERVSGPDAEAHLSACGPCRFLVEDGGRMAQALGSARGLEPTIAVAEMAAPMEATLRAESGVRGWLMSRSRVSRVALAAAFLFAAGAIVLWVMPRGDLGEYPMARLVAAVGGFTVLALLATWHALRPLYLPPAPRWLSWAVFAVGLAGPLLWAFLARAPDMLPRRHELAPVWMLDCFLIGCLSGAALVLLVRGLDRGGRTGVEMALLGAAFAGLAGNVGLALHCPITHPAHLVAGHATVPLGLLGVVGLGQYVFRAERRPRA